MAISIQTNVNSLTAQENLRVTTEFQGQTIQRLTSGFRINASGDDAAGLAVANKYRSQIAELSQGVRNANDGISQLQVIDGGLNNVSKILDRLKTLATQSSSTTFTGDRTTLNNEFKSLLGEIDRQAKNIKLDSAGTYASKMSVYIGGGNASNATNSNAQVTVDLAGSAVDSSSLGISNASVLGGGVGFSSTTNSRLDNPAAIFSASQNFTVNYVDSNGVAQQKTVGYTGSGTKTGAEVVSDINAAIKTNGVDGISAQIGSDGQLQFVGSGAFTVSTTGADNAAVDNAGNSAMRLVNTAKHHLETSSFAAYAAGGGTSASDELTFTDATTNKTVVVTLDDSNAGSADAAVNTLNAAFKAAGVSISALNTGNNQISYQSAGDFAIALTAHTAGAGGGTGDSFGGTLGNVGATSIDSQASATGAALAAVDAIAAAVTKLGTVQGKVGTGQNQLGYAIQLAQSQISNFSAAESRIRDTDVAAEAANLTKAQVLQQASMAAMAQANSAPQAVLSLLRG